MHTLSFLFGFSETTRLDTQWVEIVPNYTEQYFEISKYTNSVRGTQRRFPPKYVENTF